MLSNEDGKVKPLNDGGFEFSPPSLVINYDNVRDDFASEAQIDYDDQEWFIIQDEIKETWVRLPYKLQAVLSCFLLPITIIEELTEHDVVVKAPDSNGSISANRRLWFKYQAHCVRGSFL